MPGAHVQLSDESSMKRSGPAWLRSALDAPFFTPCPEHSTGGFSHKTDRNFYCLDCHDEALCTFCVDKTHRNHDILQIRRASHNNAVRVNEIQQVNTEGVQQYTINGSKILFLKGRRPPQPWRGGYHFCEVCGRSLLDAMRFCSLACKVAAVQGLSDPTVSMQPGAGSKGVLGEARHILSKRDHKRLQREERLKHSKRQFQQQREAAAAASKQEASWRSWREAAAGDGEEQLREMIRSVLDMVGYEEEQQRGSKRRAEEGEGKGDVHLSGVVRKRKRSHLGQQGETRRVVMGGESGEHSASSTSGAVHAEQGHSSGFGLPSSSGHSHSQVRSEDEATSLKREGQWVRGTSVGLAAPSTSGTNTADSGLALSSNGMRDPEEVCTQHGMHAEEPVLKKCPQRIEGGNSSENEHSCVSEPHSPVSVLRQRSGNFGQRVAVLPPGFVF